MVMVARGVATRMTSRLIISHGVRTSRTSLIRRRARTKRIDEAQPLGLSCREKWHPMRGERYLRRVAREL